MIKIKHFTEAIEADDGLRIWVEPIGLTRDLQMWCGIDRVLMHLGPPMDLWKWFESHSDGYDFFRGKYHEYLSDCPHKPELMQMAQSSIRENFTLVFQSDNPQENTATALYEFISELSAYCPPES